MVVFQPGVLGAEVDSQPPHEAVEVGLVLQVVETGEQVEMG